MEKKNIYTKKNIKAYNEDMHFASDLKGGDLYDIDESEEDDFKKWVARQTTTEVLPLYKRLDATRTQGKLNVDIFDIDNEIHLIPESGTVSFCSFYSDPLDNELKAGAQYTALAVNNLSSIAEALGKVIGMCERMAVLLKVKPTDFTEYNEAKAALKAIS